MGSWNQLKVLAASPVLLLAWPFVSFAVTPEISIRSSEGLILNPESRLKVLEVAKRELATDSRGLIATMGEVPSPFTVIKPKEKQAAAVATITSYDDASVLDVVAALFARQVRGSMSSGGVTFLQLEGGALMRPGSRFPAKLPEMPGQTYDIQIESISTQAYELRLGEARVRMTYDRADPNSSRIRVDN